MPELICTVCGGKREIGRKQCHECYKKAARERSKKRNKLGIRTMYTKKCPICSNPFTTTRKSSIICIECYRKNVKRYKSEIRYKFIGKNTRQHREIAEQLLNRKLETNEHVHHLDGDTLNNNVYNLIIISNRDHSRLHRYLSIKLSIVEKNLGIQIKNIDPLKRDVSLSYIFSENIAVIKLWKVTAPMGKLADPIE